VKSFLNETGANGILSLFEQSFEYEAGGRVSNLHHTRPLSEALTGGSVGLRFSASASATGVGGAAAGPE
jgi:hypothetical protein